MVSREGFIDFHHKQVVHLCQIWYRIAGPWPTAAFSRPLLTLHGGPGYTHDYMLPLEDLCLASDHRTVIFFDQLGSGKSTHLPEKLLDYSFWTEGFFLDQVTAVLRHLNIQDDYDLLGHSWGGMLATVHAARQPLGLRHMVIAHAPVASSFWRMKYLEFRERMPEPHRSILKRPRTINSSEDAEYSDALKLFYKRHFIRLDQIPQELARSWEEIEADPTATLSSLGPDEFNMTGSLAQFTAVDDIPNIKAKTLVLNGVDEGCDHEESIRIFKRIHDCTHVVFDGSTHFSHFEERPRFMALVGEFLSA